MNYAKTNVRHVVFLLLMSKMINDSSTEQPYEGADEKELFQSIRYYFLANPQQNHFLLPMKQYHADHRFTSLNRHLPEQ